MMYWELTKQHFGLTNGKRGNNASYTPWSSFAIVEGKDLEFIVHLDKPTEVRKVVFGSLFNPAMRMLPAGGVAVEVSADGQQYTQIAEKALKHDCPGKREESHSPTLSNSNRHKPLS